MNRKIFYTGGSPADSHNQPGGSSGAPDAVTGGGNDYYDQRFQTVVSPPQSEVGQGPYSDNQSGGLSNFFNTVGGGIGNVGNYYKNNSRGILGSMLGSALFGPLGMILGGYAGRNFDSIRDRFAPDVETDENEDTELRNKLLSTQFGLMPEPKPEGIFSIQPDLPDISNLQAKLNRPEEVELGILNGKKEMESTFGPLSPKEQDRLQELEQKKNESNLGLGYFTV
tara:strand:- start:45 stop:719 length:675 start_codon:yes stop_codon:yes gene_type:complete